MNRIILGSVFALSLGVLGCRQVTAVSPGADSAPDSTPVPEVVAQVEPNQDNLEMQCNGSISVNDIDYTVQFTRAAGFSQIELRRRSTGQQIAQTFLSFDGTNAQGQAIWRGAVNDAANVTLVHLASRPAQRGDQVSVGYDGQWGRGTCG